MARYAKLNKSNVVVNVVELDPDEYEMETYQDSVPSEDACIGMHYNPDTNEFFWGPEKALIDKELKKQELQNRIHELEATTFLSRGSRELELVNMEDRATKVAADTGSTKELVLAANFYYIKLKALDTQIAELRTQLQEVL